MDKVAQGLTQHVSSSNDAQLFGLLLLPTTMLLGAYVVLTQKQPQAQYMQPNNAAIGAKILQHDVRGGHNNVSYGCSALELR